MGNILKRKAHIQCIQEHSLTNGQWAEFTQQANKYNKSWIGGPLDPELGRPTVGVGILADDSLVFYEPTTLTKEYEDMKATGICAIYCTDVDGTTVTCACIHGWPGAKPRNEQASNRACGRANEWMDERAK